MSAAGSYRHLLFLITSILINLDNFFGYLAIITFFLMDLELKVQQ